MDSELWSREDEEESEDENATEDEEETRPERRKFSLGQLGRSIARSAAAVGDSLARTAAAAGELMVDSDLRTRSAALLASAAQSTVTGVAKGLQQGAGRIAAGPRTMQGILQKLQQRIEEQRLQALLQEQQDTPVDVQVAFQLYEDAPQELRSRLWMAVLEHPELCAEYQALAAELQQERQGAAVAGASASSAAAAGQPPATAGDEAGAGSAAGNASNAEQTDAPGLSAAAAPLGPAEAAAASSVGGDGMECQQQTAADPAHLSSSYSAGWASHHVDNTSHRTNSQHQQQAEDSDGWHLVNDHAAARKLQGARLLARATEIPPYSRHREGFRNILMTAMMSIPWPLPNDYPADCRYATLLQISVGQEDIDEIISRDIHRTFPEYPLFAFEQGQQALFNVLKAYALHDMEAAYCQGMAFVAGLLLFYVPEEPAFQLFCRLLSTSGPNLRRLYLPGLEGLKAELRKLDFLLERFLPNLTAHLTAAGVVPVLFASQWLLTCFSCPFPVGFACRLIDVMLQENNDAILLKTAVTILAECEGDLLMQEDFESLLTFLKVEPVQWSPQRLRRVLNAAIASPITAQDLADAETALQQGFTGSLSRAPTFSAEAEVNAPEEEAEAAAAAAAAAGAAGLAASGTPASSRPHSRHPSSVSQAAVAQQADASQAGVAAVASASDDTVAAELAAAQQQIDDELMNMVLMLDLDFGGGDAESEATYSSTLHSAVQANTANKPIG